MTRRRHQRLPRLIPPALILLFTALLANADLRTVPGSPPILKRLGLTENDLVDIPAQSLTVVGLPQSQKLQSAFERRLDCQFNGAPLQKVFEDFRKAADIAIVLEGREFDLESDKLHGSVRLNWRDTTLRTAMTMILGPLDLTWLESNDTLIVADSRVASTVMFTREYQVEDLVRTEQRDKPIVDCDSLIESIRLIDPDSWDKRNGHGRIDFFEAKFSLSINQNEMNHRDIKSLLLALRAGGNRQEKATKEGKPSKLDRLKLTISEKRSLADSTRTLFGYSPRNPQLQAALKKRIDLSFNDTPFLDVFRFLGRAGNINTLILFEGLSFSHIETDQPVMLDSRGMTLGAALDYLLAPMDLVWSERDNVLLITDLDTLWRFPQTRVYFVGDLVASATDEVVVTSDSLLDLIGMIEPNSWIGERGFPQPVYIAATRSIVVRQHDVNLRRIDAMMHVLRALARKSG